MTRFVLLSGLAAACAGTPAEHRAVVHPGGETPRALFPALPPRGADPAPPTDPPPAAWAPEGDRWVAGHATQRLRGSVGSDGLAVELLTEEAAWSGGIRAAAFGRPPQLVAVARTRPTRGDDRIVLDHGVLREWYRYDERGFEQGFDVAASPEGVGPLRIEVELLGDYRDVALAADGQSLLATDSRGRPRGYVREPVARDARGTTLPVELERADAGFAIVVDDDGGQYPVSIDPILTAPGFWMASPFDFTRLGHVVAAAGDLNADGFGDLFASAANDLVPTPGYFTVVKGTSLGLGGWAWYSEFTAPDFAVRSASSVGDVSGDGIDDLLVGTSGIAGKGLAYLWFGGPNRFDERATHSNADWKVPGNSQGLGDAVHGGRDMDGDGVNDFAIGEPGYDNYRGRVMVFSGKAGGPSSVPAWIFEGDVAGDGFGADVDVLGDYDGDGLGDLAVVSANRYATGPKRPHKVSVFLSANGVAPPVTVLAEHSLNQLVTGLRSLRDLGGDGPDGLLVMRRDWGAAPPDTRIDLHSGTGIGVQETPHWSYDRATPVGSDVVSFESLATMDLNGDLHQDFVAALHRGVGSPLQIVASQLHVFLGGRLSPTQEPLYDHVIDLEGWCPVAGLPDANGDAFEELAFGRPDSTFVVGGTFQGLVEVHHGGADPATWVSAWHTEGDQTRAHVGADVAFVGDVDGDGIGDLAVGAPFLASASGGTGVVRVFYGTGAGFASTADFTLDAGAGWRGLGSVVEPAGDVDGDGFADILIGGATPTVAGGRGKAVVLLGQSGGLSATNVWEIFGDPEARSFGNVVAPAGDVNLDGYDDFLVAEPHAPSFGGVVFLYEGGPTSPSAAPTWSFRQGQVGDGLGAALAPAGDLNGDGIPDVLIGAPYYDDGTAEDAGRVFCFFGDADGFEDRPAWTVSRSVAGERLGRLVRGVGDIDGSGTPDIAYEQRVQVDLAHIDGDATGWIGSLNFARIGPSGHPHSGPTGLLPLNGAQRVSVVEPYGDTDGDGLHEVLVGWSDVSNTYPREGAVSHVTFPGGSWNVEWTALGGAPELLWGSALAVGDDLDGDGLPDFAVAALGASSPEVEEGEVHLLLTGSQSP